MSCNSSEILFCQQTDGVFQWSKSQCVLPARCVGCPYQICFNVMRERVRDNLNESQLEFDFDYVEKEVTDE